MAKSVYKKTHSDKTESLGNETFNFMTRKIKGFLPEHIISFIFALITYIIMENFGLKKIINYVIESLPSFFLLQMFGFKFEIPNNIEWYISAMLLVMLMLYPLMMKNYDCFVNIIAPIISLGLLGYLSYTYGSLTGVMVWTGFCYKSVLRAIAEIALGTVAFEICRKFSELELSKSKRFLLSVLEIVCFVTVMVFVIFTFPKKYEFHVLFVITLLVILAFSNQTFYPAVFDSIVVKWMGKFTLPIYLCQISGVYIVCIFGDNLTHAEQMVVYIVSTFILSVICIIITNLFRKRAQRKTLEKA